MTLLEVVGTKWQAADGSEVLIVTRAKEEGGATLCYIGGIWIPLDMLEQGYQRVTP